MPEKLNTYVPEETFDDQDWEVFSKWVKGVLMVQPAKITFTKKDGSERIMNCTLRPDLLPHVEIKEDASTRKKNDNVVSVYDLEQDGWRSFVVKSVKKVEFLIEND